MAVVRGAAAYFFCQKLSTFPHKQEKCGKTHPPFLSTEKSSKSVEICKNATKIKPTNALFWQNVDKKGLSTLNAKIMWINITLREIKKTKIYGFYGGKPLKTSFFCG